MGLIRSRLPSYKVLTEERAEMVATGGEGYAVEVRPPRSGATPETLSEFVRKVMEIQTRLLGIWNGSPCVAYEIRRGRPDDLQLQYVAPTKRVERKIRTQLSTEVPGVGFQPGVHGLPVTSEDSIGGAILCLGKSDRFSLRTEFDAPPPNGVVSALHRHAMRDTKFVIQILFQPLAGHPVRRRLWRRRAYREASAYRKENDELWDRSPTPRERRQAELIEEKADTRGFAVSIRFVVIGAGEFTPSRVKELVGAFNVYENPVSGQYLDPLIIRGLRKKPFIGFCKAVNRRQFDGYSLRFRATTEEVGALVAIPDRRQENLSLAEP